MIYNTSVAFPDIHGTAGLFLKRIAIKKRKIIKKVILGLSLRGPLPSPSKVDLASPSKVALAGASKVALPSPSKVALAGASKVPCPAPPRSPAQPLQGRPGQGG